MIPTGFESEQAVEIDQDAWQGDRYGRLAAAYLGGFTGIFGRHGGDGFFGGDGGALCLYRKNRQALWLLSAEASRQGPCAAFSGACQRLSRQQITRLVKRGREPRKLTKRYQRSRTRFATIYIDPAPEKRTP